MGPLREALKEVGRQDAVNSNGMSVHGPGEGGGRTVAHSTGLAEIPPTSPLGDAGRTLLASQNFISFL